MFWRSIGLIWLAGVTVAVADRNLNRPGWTLHWHDEFDGGAVDTSKWNIDDQPAPANNELEWYSRDNVAVEDGLLVLTSEQREINGYQYASGKVTTAGRFDTTFGRIEVRAKLPTGQGMWPAHWMLPYGKWPPEIDIMEMIGSVPNRVTMSVHWGPLPPGKSPWDIGQTRHADYWGPDFSQGFHTFAVEWYRGWLSWQVDGVERHSSWEGVPEEPMFLILNTAVGGDWPGPPDWTTQWPQRHEIDYVRVYKRAEGRPVLLNAGFEEGEGGNLSDWNRWDGGNVGRETNANHARTGRSAVRMTGRSSGGTNASGVFQSLPAGEGDRWRAAAWARHRPGDRLEGANAARVKLEFVDAAGAVIWADRETVVSAASVDGYRRGEVVGLAPAGTVLARVVAEFEQVDGAAGSVVFDDLELETVEPEPGVLTNGDFEQWDGGAFVGWSHYDTGNVVRDGEAANARSGRGAVHAWGRYNSSDNRSGLFQDLPAAGGEWWEATVYARNRPGDGVEGRSSGNLKLEFIDDGGGVLEVTQATVVRASSDERYRPYVVRAQAPDGTAAARVVLEVRQREFTDGSVNFDDAGLRRIPAYRAWIAGYVDPNSAAADATGDLDGDGQDNGGEFLAQTDPTDAASALRVGRFEPEADGGTAEVAWTAEPGVRYRVVGTAALGEWTVGGAGSPAVVLAEGLALPGAEAGELSARVGLGGGAVRYLRVEVEEE